MRLRTLIPLCLLILAAPRSTVCQTVPAGSFRVGAAKVDITPALNELPKSYLGVLDHVYSRAIVIDNGQTSAALITLDAGVVPTDLWKAVSDRIEKELGIPSVNVLDVPIAIRALGEAIFHVHAKDVALDRLNVARNGVIDNKSYGRIADRSWVFRTVGWGHDELEWKRIVSSLRLIRYDYVLSIEHEDAMMSTDDGIASAVNFLQRVVLTEPPIDAW